MPDVAPDESRVNTMDNHMPVVVRARETLLELDRPHEEPELRVAVGLNATGTEVGALLVVHVRKVEHAAVMEDGAGVDNARSFGLLNGWKEVEGEEAVGEEVYDVGKFKALIRDLPLPSRKTSVVDEDVAGSPGLDPLLPKRSTLASEEQSISHSSIIDSLTPAAATTSFLAFSGFCSCAAVIRQAITTLAPAEAK